MATQVIIRVQWLLKVTREVFLCFSAHHPHHRTIVTPRLIEILSQGDVDNEWEINFIIVFLYEMHLKCIKYVWRAIINNNNTLHHLFYGHCVNSSVIVFGPWYPNPSPPISHNGLIKDGAQLLLSRNDYSQWPAFVMSWASSALSLN